MLACLAAMLCLINLNYTLRNETLLHYSMNNDELPTLQHGSSFVCLAMPRK